MTRMEYFLFQRSAAHLPFLLQTINAILTEGELRKWSMILCAFEPAPEAKMAMLVVSRESVVSGVPVAIGR